MDIVKIEAYDGVMTSHRFFKMADGSYVRFRVANIKPPTKCYYCESTSQIDGSVSQLCDGSSKLKLE